VLGIAVFSHDVAPEKLHVNIELFPGLTNVGFAVNVAVGGLVGVVVTMLNVAVTVLAELIANVHVKLVCVPSVHVAPLHPANVEPLAAVAVNVTDVPLLYDSMQSVPQLIPVGELVTVPVPVFLTFKE
jgi:hypothetical protein